MPERAFNLRLRRQDSWPVVEGRGVVEDVDGKAQVTLTKKGMGCLIIP